MDAPSRPPPTAWELIEAIRRVNRILRARFEDAFAESAVSFTGLEIMLILDEEPNLHVAALARRLLITRQSAHRVVEGLRLSGLVEVLP